MKAEVKLMNVHTHAADGSTISAHVIEKYLKSKAWQEQLDRKLALGGMTHKSRVLGGEAASHVGPDDGIFLDSNVAFYITKSWLKENGDWMAEIEILEPDEFSGTQRDTINEVRGLLKSGVLPPTSIVIAGEWDYNNALQSISKLIGLDITYNPSFPGAGITKVYSQVAPFEGTKTATRVVCFSQPNEIEEYKTKVFSKLTKFRREFAELMIGSMNPEALSASSSDELMQLTACSSPIESAVQELIGKRLNRLTTLSVSDQFRELLLDYDREDMKSLIMRVVQTDQSDVMRLKLGNGIRDMVVRELYKLQYYWDTHRMDLYYHQLEVALTAIEMFGNSRKS